jgi:hypothetical protein
MDPDPVVSLPGERWRPIPAFPGCEEGFPGYEVSDFGNGRTFFDYSAHKGRLAVPVPIPIPPSPNPKGYVRFALRTESGRLVKPYAHKLVLLAFVGPREVGLQTRHLDGDPSNNRLSNLAYGTAKENAQDTIRHGTARPYVPPAMLSGTSAEDALRMQAAGFEAAEIATRLGVTRHAVYNLYRRAGTAKKKPRKPKLIEV